MFWGKRLIFQAEGGGEEGRMGTGEGGGEEGIVLFRILTLPDTTLPEGPISPASTFREHATFVHESTDVLRKLPPRSKVSRLESMDQLQNSLIAEGFFFHYRFDFSQKRRSFDHDQAFSSPLFS